MTQAARLRLPSRKTSLLLTFTCGLFGVVCCAAPAVPESFGATRGLAGTSELYDLHCAICHGHDGAGDGPASTMLDPAPRDFGLGLFALVSTRNGVPTVEDLEGAIRRGMPGSAMPSFDWMSEAELGELAQHVRDLALAGITRQLRIQADERGDTLSEDAARRLAEVRMRPGEVISFADAPEPVEATAERGRALYLAQCAACHGVGGTGRKPVPEWDDTHNIWSVRDFTAGIMKGETSREALARRIVAGMPSSGMPPTPLVDADLAALVRHVEDLIPSGAESRLVQSRKAIVASRVAAAPSEPDDAAWNAIDETRVAMAPFRWDSNAVVEAHVAAVHDGTRLALRIRWVDATCDQRVLSGSGSSDAAAVQWSGATRPPLFGMGSLEHPVNIWHWKAFRFRDVAGHTDLMTRSPHSRFDRIAGGVDAVDVPLYQPAPGITKPSETADSVGVGGFEQLPRSRDEFACEAKPVWQNGVWTVVLRRVLEARAEREIDLAPGSAVQVGFAIWDGSRGAGPRGKSITIWHELSLER